MATNSQFLAENISWINELAKSEINPDAHNILNSLSELDPKALVEESAVEILQTLRDIFNDYARAFNSYSESGNRYNEVKVYGITNTAADFMVFRNSVKLVFSNTTHGIINISFSNHNTGSVMVNGNLIQNQSAMNLTAQSKDLIAQLGPFLDVSWTYQGEKIELERLAKYYFVEFTKASRAEKKESANQALLKQIKTLLQDKGINL